MVEAIVLTGRTTLDEPGFSAFDFDGTDLARGLICRPFYLQLNKGELRRVQARHK
jgi:hypothetical protein